MLVEMMQGSIGVDNIIGEGCIFWVDLQKEAPQKIITETHSSCSSSLADEQEASVDLLYIEDNSTNCLLMRKIISRHPQFKYSEAFNGTDGIDMALSIKPKIILLDINLPDMDGFEVFKKLQQHKRLASTKVIIVSANAMPQDISKGQKLGIFDYVTKPINQEKLLMTLHKALSAKH